MTTNGESTPVLVVGAGPVGLTTAVLLATRGVRALVVERHPGTSIWPRARGISGAAMRVFGEAGVAAEVRAAGRVLRKNRLIVTVETLAGAELDREVLENVVDEDDPQGVRNGFTLCPQDRLEPVLLTRARELGVAVRFGVELTGLEQDAGGVTARLRTRETGEERAVRAGFVAGADGTHGPVREAAGIALDGPGELGRHVNVLFRAELADLARGREFLFCMVKTPESPGILAPIDNVSRWQFTVSPGRDEDDAAFTGERCRALVRAAMGLPDLDVRIEHVLFWRPTLRLAESLHRGRVALAGDAAHELPAGGLGNGVGDAAVLVPCLVEALSSDSPEPLARYTEERLPAVRETAERIYANTGPDGLPT